VLVGDLPAGRLAAGLAAQAVWTAAGALGVAVVWRFGVRRYTAVNN
jgi:ABC-2 type transport system permease protein